MDDFKPEDDMKADRNDRRAGRSRQSSERDADPQINFDDVDLDADEGRPTRAGKARREREEEEFEEELDAEDEELLEEQPVERRPRKRKKAPAKPASRQYIMMGVGILVLLLLIVGIGSALKSPSSSSQQTASGEKSINLSDDQSTSTPTPAAGQDQTAAANTAPQQDVTVPPIAANPTQGQAAAEPQGQQRVEVQGDLNNALTQQQGQLDGAVANSTLPTEPATVAPIRNGANGTAAPRQATERQTAATPRPAERKHTVIEAKPQTKPQAVAKAPVETKPVQPKHVESAATTAPAKTTVTESKPVATAQSKPAATATTTTAAPAAKSGKTAGDVSSMKSAPSGNYTLQLSSSSNYDNLNNWAKKEKLDRYVVYETSRNGQPWYVLVSGIYASKEEAKRAVTSLPADVQAKNPWAKPLHQVQADLK
ncbi:cell division protein DamX [Klebsiella sp. G-Nf4]|uniref:cell division protein DamX n=1 Tax=unclassified Klebsiella TaxID=2608929 RepID=UPI000C282582|nr:MULTISPECIES: cell division protein DamX [unclassified Klebsiella]PJR54085.1 cell division protein DamX [Klebsiella sp. I-Nf8]PJX28777.1 cell division protein DamX [Klebsiella sp. A-Nf5]PJX38240.1 cell division protein DamX [Klebsiella sp. B-Nf7]PJX49726.1 cell division protein DamX [Klebsiella sp. C1-16S-Nf17]PJX68594.1 cell division protein DamX [Klebsiella sp. G-Nf4]